ncbi:MAG: Galactose-1-phosphate uridylyltransferase [Candidatus Omnitrophica bacterium]|nr:Galactose-1-phosphate uridylyltransferase [Candidatus Omnitrophota bacterium]
MPQLRKDPVTSRWVIVQSERPLGPDDFKIEQQSRSSRACPFCPGNESMTPPEIVSYGRKGAQKPGAGPWQVRVVPNKFPALRIEESLDKMALGVYDRIGGFGAHEVIIESPEHDREIADQPLEQVVTLLRVYRDRCLDLRKDPRFKYVLIFKNFGAQAGASQEHPHSQLIALPVVPSRVMGEVKGSQKHFEHTDRCIFCDMMDQERAEHRLAVYENERFIAIEPFASRFPYETWILPREHQSTFELTPEEHLTDLADALKTALYKIKTLLHNPPYNFMIHSLPIHGREEDSFHWQIEIIPQLTEVSGFELGTGFYINPTPPERAAEALRRVPRP